jgi:hypothetical protein
MNQVKRTIPRPEAEAARRRAQALSESPGPHSPEDAVELLSAVAVWNAFCAQEQARLDDAERRARAGTPAAWLFAGRGSGARR